MSFKTIIPVLALAAAAVAQTSSCSTSGTLTIASAADATAISACTTYSGSIAIQTAVTADIAIDGVEVITGDLIADNAIYLPALSADSLTSIEGDFTLTNMTLLTSLDFPLLASVGSIIWTTLPRLSSLTFTTGVSTATILEIVDTELGSLDGISLTTVDELLLSNNLALDELNMPLTTISTSFAIEFNGDDMVVDLPDLVNAYNMTFRNATSVTMPLLSSVNETLGFYGCDFTSLDVANLTSVGSTLTLTDNADLANISFPLLTTITGALDMSVNPLLTTITFPKLKTVGGAVDVTGNFTSFTLPDLTEVAGAFTLASSGDISTDCTHFDDETGSGSVILGTFSCTSDDASSGSTTASASGSSSTSTSTTSSAASPGFYARSSAVTGIVGLFAAMFGLL